MSASTLQRRLTSEWQLLTAMSVANATRLSDLHAEDLVFSFRLTGTTALLAGGGTRTEHGVQITFPFTFPAAPLELSLSEPVFHPNVHPVTGFVCLWDQHRALNTTEHALLKTAAMLNGKLWNRRAEHLMQPEAIPVYASRAAHLADEPLRAVTSYEPAPLQSAAPRRRLS